MERRGICGVLRQLKTPAHAVLFSDSNPLSGKKLKKTVLHPMILYVSGLKLYNDSMV